MVISHTVKDPYYTGKSFFCNDNKLTTLEHCPNYVGKVFDCSYNFLTALDHCPEHVGKYIDCCFNKIKTRISAGGVFMTCSGFYYDFAHVNNTKFKF